MTPAELIAEDRRVLQQVLSNLLEAFRGTTERTPRRESWSLDEAIAEADGVLADSVTLFDERPSPGSSTPKPDAHADGEMMRVAELVSFPEDTFDVWMGLWRWLPLRRVTAVDGGYRLTIGFFQHLATADGLVCVRRRAAANEED